MDVSGPGQNHEIIGRAERYDFPTPIQLITRGGKIFIGEYPSFASFDRIVEKGDWYRGITLEPQSVPEERKEINIGEEVKSGEMRINNIDNINNRNNRNNINMNIPAPNRLESVQSYPTTEPNSLREDVGTSGFPLQEESKNTTLAASNGYPLNVRRSETQVCSYCRNQVSNVITCLNQHLICSSCLAYIYIA